jgi:hypothetical protein
MCWTANSAREPARVLLAFNTTKEFAMSKHTSDPCAQQPREDASPYQAIRTIKLLAQDADSHARRIYGDDVLSFKLWLA